MPRVRIRRRTARVSVYGRARVWKVRRDGVRQRYRVTARFVIKGTTGTATSTGTLYKAVKFIKDKRLNPVSKEVKVNARKLIYEPWEYATTEGGRFEDIEVESLPRRGRRRGRRR